MYIRQRQEETKSSSIQGRRIINNITYVKKQIRTLSPQLFIPMVRQQTFEIDSFKELLTKRSGSHIVSKENVSLNQRHVRKIKQQEGKDFKQKSSKNKKTKRSTEKIKHSSSANKFHTVKHKNLIKEQNKKERKSYSPVRDHKEYRSGPMDKKNYVSNNISSKTSRDMIFANKSEKNLIKNPLQCLLEKPSKINKKLKMKEKKKKTKNNSSIVNTKRNNNSKAETIAKEFDLLLKESKIQKSLKSQSAKKKRRKSNQKTKKVIISNHNTLNNIQNKAPHLSDYSSDGYDSPEKLMDRKYQRPFELKQKKPGRHSLQPKKPTKQPTKIKTEEYSPEKLSVRKMAKIESTIILQKNIRSFLHRRIEKKNHAFIQSLQIIQKSFKGFVTFITLKKYKINRKKQYLLENSLGLGQILQGKQYQNADLIGLLQDILKQEKVSARIKQKISTFLAMQKSMVASSKNSARSSINSHYQQQMRSQRRFMQQQLSKNTKNKQLLSSPNSQSAISHYRSPKIDKQYLSKSPEIMIDNLLTIQQFQREKIINRANLQRQGIQHLAFQKIFSPKTGEMKKKQVDKKLEVELNNFDKSIQQVIKNCKKQDFQLIKPFSGVVTPQHQKSGAHDIQIGSEKLMHDLSMELLEYYQQKTQQKDQTKYIPFDCTFQFIDEYLLNLFEFLRQKGEQYRLNFLIMMKNPKNLQTEVVLKNLCLITQDQQDDVFKLPMYKYLENDEKQLLSQQQIEEFNQQYTKLQRHHYSIQNISESLQEVYLKMLIDCTNEALNNQRPIQYIFTQTALHQCSSRRLLQLQQSSQINFKFDLPQNSSEIENIKSLKIQQQFELHFASAMNQIYRWAHFQAGITQNSQLDEQTIRIINEKKYNDLNIEQAQKKWENYDQLIEVITGLSNNLFEELFFEAAYQIQFLRHGVTIIQQTLNT